MILLKCLLIFLVIFLPSEVYALSNLLDEFSQIKLTEDGKLTFPELSEKYGHPTTEHEITTEDGYVLTVFRQPGDVKRPILLIHGNTPTGDCWVLRGNGSLSITLANLGYDVWTINIRGTRYSRKHKTLNPDKDENQFFNYTFYEEAIYDVPAVIDYVLQETEQEQLMAVGHSVGTTLLYILGSEKPEYNEKIKLGISLAPISFLQNLRGLAAVGSFFKPVLDIFDAFNIEEVASHHGLGSLIRLLCLQPLGYDLCIKGALFQIFGYNEDGIERGFEKTLFGHAPGGSTTKIFKHLIQIIRRNKFAKFDYGETLNLAEYGTSEPPEFDLSKVTMKSAIFVGKEDYVATEKDAERLNASLPNVVHYEVLPFEKFTHSDFVWGRRMSELLYPYLLDVIKKYT